MKLGVVIPCYNHAKYVGPAIESVLNQTRPPDRFLIIDDGSKDDSVDVIRSYEKDGVELIVQENAGAHNTINRAIEGVSANCDLVSILNSDDIYETGRFEALLPSFDAGKSVVCSDLRLIDSMGEILAADEPRGKWFRAAWSMRGSELLEWLGVANFLGTTSNVIARSTYFRANPFRPYRFNHDYFFLAGAAVRDELAVVPEKLLRYRVHDSNTINTDPAPLLREMLRMHLDLYAAFSDEMLNDEAMRQRFFRFARAGWDNVSSFHAGLFQLLTAKLAENAGDEALANLVASLDVDELNRYPNSALVHHHDGEGPLLDPSGLAEKFGELKRSQSAVKADNTALKKLTRLRAELMESRWIALGRFLGAGKKLAANVGKTPEEKLANFQAAISQSRWVKFGKQLGFVQGEGS